jgi:hypothetical protein
MIREATRIWSRLSLLGLRERLPGFPSLQGKRGRTPPYTINTATVQLCRIDRPGSPRPTVDPRPRDRVIHEARARKNADP